MKYGIGQKVRVKDFSELVKEFGVEPNGNVLIGNYYFDRQMKVYCGEEYRIKNTYADGTYGLDLQDGGDWVFSEEMLETEKPVILGVDIAQQDDIAVGDKPKRTCTRKSK